MDVSRATRKNILDFLAAESVSWYGRLDDVQFLSRLFDLEKLASTDSRFRTAAADIRQHRISNDDWENDWLFTDARFDLLGCPDELFLTFLTEMLHPVVRPDPAEAERLAGAMNDLLRDDHFELVVRTRLGGRPVWAARRRSLVGSGALAAVRGAREKFDADYVLQQITRMETAVETDPGLAIGTAKELVETTCRAILEARGQATTGSEDLPKLVRLVAEELALVPGTASARSRDPDTVRKILGSLATVVAGIAELRNTYGTGHGRSPKARGLGPRHAKLAVGAAATLAVFLYETHEERQST